MECLAKIYLKYCKCIQYYMPRPDDDVIFIVCNCNKILIFQILPNHKSFLGHNMRSLRFILYQKFNELHSNAITSK